ncbi:MAG: DUF2141 domain-containing protein [Eudoraea sp.]|nr:DUF2141 domain-containing protein [Eudoraea sp.]
MKSMLFLFTVLLLSVSSLRAQTTTGETIEVTIENVMTDGGHILAALHTEETFMKNDGIASAFAYAKKGVVTFSFDNVQPGTYAIMVMHDLNGNNQMDFEANGMPKENYGVSGNEMLMGPPTFESSKFRFESSPISLKIRF